MRAVSGVDPHINKTPLSTVLKEHRSVTRLRKAKKQQPFWLIRHVETLTQTQLTK